MISIIGTASLRKNWRTLLLAVAACGLLACSPESESQDEDGQEGYAVVGKVLELFPERSAAKIAHEDIPDFMPAMTMDFLLDPGDLKWIEPGQAIQGRLIRTDDGGFKLVKIWPAGATDSSELKRLNQRLQKQVKALPTGRYLGEGDDLPDFALVDQNGKTITSELLAGKPFVLNFIFTRCPDPNMCPLSTSMMVQLQKRTQEAGIEDVAFVSVTMDPKFDTPGVLKQYAESYDVDESNFHFVTGPRPAIRNLLQALGVTAIEQQDNVMHSLATTLVGPKGDILLRSEKSEWEIDRFFQGLEEAVD